MPEEFEEGEGPENLDQPPAFFPYEGITPPREHADMGELAEVQIEGVFAAESNGQVAVRARHRRRATAADSDRPLEAQAIQPCWRTPAPTDR